MSAKLPFDKNHEFMKVISDNPELLMNETHSLPIKTYLKNVYDYAKTGQSKCKESISLPKLIIDNLDSEQIWQQLELQNTETLNRVTKKFSKLLSLQTCGDEQKENETHESDNSSDENKYDENDSEESGIDEAVNSNEDSQSEGNFSEEDLEEEEKVTSQSKSKVYKKTIVDDEFFKLNEMEDFLISEEKKMDESADKNQDSEEDDDEEDIDLFAEDEEEEDEGTNARMAKFKDFFRPQQEEEKPKRNKFLDELSEDETENIQSNFELRQGRLVKRIEAIEEKAVAEKPWTLKGEIRADSRPINSLLEEDVEFDRTTRPAPVVTGQTTVQLEDLIRQRIKDRAFDSVERKVKVVDEPYEFKKKLVLNQEKSKESLAQIYEKEYLEQKAAQDPETVEKEAEEPELHKEIKKMMKTLFNQLDALSNYHYTPKPAIPEIKIVANIPALNTEEVGPVAVSDAPILAPQEVKAKTKGELLGKSERTSTDKKRERRKKKSKQRYHAKLKEKNENEDKKSGKTKNVKAEQQLKELTKDTNIKKMIQSSSSIKSSKAFFQQIDEKRKMNSDTLKSGVKRKKNTDSFNAKKLKL